MVIGTVIGEMRCNIYRHIYRAFIQIVHHFLKIRVFIQKWEEKNTSYDKRIVLIIV